MKVSHVGLLALFGMASAAASVYAITPAGGFGSKIQADASSSAERTAEPQGDGPPAKQSISEFTAGTALRVDGYVGNPKMLKNQKGETFLMLELTGAQASGTTVAPPVSLSIVIDKSGSMRGSRIQNALSGAVRAVQRLHEGDDVNVIAFDTGTETVVPRTRIDTASRDSVIRRIQAIQLGGDTCISCGIEAGLAELRGSSGTVERMIVLTDGDANNGVRDVPGFRSLGERAGAQGAAVTTIGVDVDFNEKFLSAVSLASNGRHYFAENPEAIERVFDDEAAGLTQSVASNVTANIDLASGVELVQVFDRNFNRSGNRVSVPLGTFARGETKTVLLKVRAPSSADDVEKLADVRVALRDLSANADAECTGQLGVELTSDATSVSPVEAVVTDRVQRTETATALRDANSLFSLGKADEARERLASQRANVEAQASAAASSAPLNRADDLRKDFRNQTTELDRAANGFATPPPTVGQAQPAPVEHEQKSNAKRNVEAAGNLAR